MKSYELVKKETEKRLEGVKRQLRAFESIKYKSKKDGTPFVTLNMNFENAKVVVDCFGVLQLYITGTGVFYLGYAKTGEEVTLETIKGLIAQEIEGLKKRIDNTEKQLKQLPKVYDAVLGKFKKIAEEYDSFLHMLDLEDLLAAKFYDYSDGREAKAKKENSQKQILEKIKQAIKDKMGARERDILENFAKVEEVDYNPGIGTLYKVFSKDGDFMEVRFPKWFSKTADIVG